MPRKKLDRNIRKLIESSISSLHRSMFFIYGERSKDQVLYLHHLLVKCRKAVGLEKPNILWCFKKDLGFNSFQNKRLKQFRKKYAVDCSPSKEDLFDHFLLSSSIQFCHYSETDKILGQTFGLLIIQDFEALTPNTLARIVECIEGGGMIVFLLPTLTSLKDLFNLNIDAHSRYVTEAYPKVTPRFNKRFVLSLLSCQNCLILDDHLRIKCAPNNFEAYLENPSYKANNSPNKNVPSDCQSNENLNKVLCLCVTSDQRNALLKLSSALDNSTDFSIVSLTSARGRGKSSVLGFALSLALVSSYSNIYITSPHIENLQTLFSCLIKGLSALELEGCDYKVLHTEFNSVSFVVGVRVSRGNIRTARYLPPVDAHKVGSADLVVIDEAAAIPLPLVKKWIGSHSVFMASTINGYEGTGRSLSLKLISQLRNKSASQEVSNKNSTIFDKRHVLHEVQLEEAIRYSNGDSVEEWLNHLLCLDASISMHPDLEPPQPNQCQLYYVNTGVLFGYNRAAEEFLQQVVSLFVSSHYKNSPNDLLMMADAPAHHVFCLLPPANVCTNPLPTVLCAIQISFEGKISKENCQLEQSYGRRASGDMIPWIISQQFQDITFPSLSGARVVRIATHPGYQRMGYGRHALQLLSSFYSNNHNCSTEQVLETGQSNHLLTKLSEMPRTPLDYLGVSYGLTPELFRFWKKSGFAPLYIRQTTSELTGEHSCIMIKSLDPEAPWMSDFFSDFATRFLSLVPLSFQDLPVSLILDIMQNQSLHQPKVLSKEVAQWFFSSRCLQRMSSHCLCQVDYHMILDLLPMLSKFYFSGSFGSYFLSSVQENLLASMGLQNKSLEATAAELSMELNQAMGYFKKIVSKILQKLETADLCSRTEAHKNKYETKEKLYNLGSCSNKRNGDPEHFSDKSKRYKKFRKE